MADSRDLLVLGFDSFILSLFFFGRGGGGCEVSRLTVEPVVGKL